MRMETSLPSPLVTELPISIGVFYSPELREHVYTATSESRGTWHIATGESHVRAFSTILRDLFENYRELDSLQDDRADLVLVPRISRIQFSTPEETGFEFFEAWVEYIVEIRDADGAELPAWRFTGYGQAAKERLESVESALSESFGDALRNAGARLATGLPDHPPVRARLSTGSFES